MINEVTMFLIGYKTIIKKDINDDNDVSVNLYSTIVGFLSRL